MYVTLINAHLKPEHVDDFIAATKLNHEGSIQESGNLRFDVLRLDEDATRFILYEAYVSEEDAAAHKNTPHYLKWRETVADWMASPRQGVLYRGVFPQIDKEGD